MDSERDRTDGFTMFLGFVVGYALFAGFLFLYLKTSQGGVDSSDLGWRLFTPFILIKGQWTDFVCYAIIVLSVFGIAKIRKQI
jgi:hypothetical protein